MLHIPANGETDGRALGPKLPIVGVLDFPAGYVLAQGEFTVAGWAIGPAEISGVEIFIDGIHAGDAVIGLGRPDVAAKFPGSRVAATSGFELRRLAVPPSAGTITVTALIRTANGQREELTVAVPVLRSAADALGFLGGQPASPLNAYAELAKSLLETGNFPEAEEVFGDMRKRFPHDPARYVEEARYLIQRDRLDEAEALLAAGSQRFPDDLEVIATFAIAASRRRDWPTAMRRWRIVRERFPDRPALWEEEGRALYGARQDMTVVARGKSAAAVSGAADIHAAASDAARRHHASLVLKFENLGSNCDFGSVQRYYGSEPLGLLRFSAAPLPQLLAALENGFEGVGERSNTRFDARLEPNGAIEYWLCDTCYDFEMHTFIFHDQTTTEQRLEKLLRHYCRRLALLRDELVDDLRNPEKIFVYQRPEALSRDEIASLFRAIRNYGPGVLLCGLPEDAGHPAGTVEMAEDGLLLGYLDRFSGSDNLHPAYDTWLRLCQEADRLANQSR